MNGDRQLPHSEMKPKLHLGIFEILTNVTSVQARGLWEDIMVLHRHT